MLVAKLLARELAEAGAAFVFGIPGKESLRFCAELAEVGITFVGARHETQAVMMADGYWRATGRIGVALVAQGAGLSNAIGGMACAARARSGVVVVTGDLLKADAATGPSSEALMELKGINTRVACESVFVDYVRPASGEAAHAEIRAALTRARAGRTVALAFPSDIFSAEAVEQQELPAYDAQAEAAAPSPDDVEMIAELLTSGFTARRPLVIAGKGAVRSGAIPAIRRFAEATGALLATSLPARSSFAGDPFNVGVCGTLSTSVGSGLIARADCVIAFGASLNPFTTYGQSVFAKDAQIVHVDINEAALGKYLVPAMGVVGDAGLTAEALTTAVLSRGGRREGYRSAEIAAQLAEFDPAAEFTDQSTDEFIDPRTLMVELDRVLPSARTLVVDAGLHLHNACSFLQVERPEDFIFPVDSLAIGLGMGAAVGAAFARVRDLTVLEVGDGGLMMALGDLDTAIRHRLPIVVVVSNDEAWGAEAQHLNLLGESDDFVRLPTPSLAELAVAMGAEGYTIRSRGDIEVVADRLREPLSGPIVLDCRVHPDIQPESFEFDYAGVFAK
ncbi:thiamine pyrophosphate-binding protein [Microbacterium soli]|uniref:Thiamine pyrophosphate-binding protein n=1 Tax=Microbacterium soli TaxID=446075 RepID=A0ABP7NCA7_9MICO